PTWPSGKTSTKSISPISSPAACRRAPPSAPAHSRSARRSSSNAGLMPARNKTARRPPKRLCGERLLMLRRAAPLVLGLLLVPQFVAPSAAAEPSFDCRTKTARELATCGDVKLAAADRELEAAWREAIARLDPVTAKALREDQRKFLSDIDDGFDAELW